MANLNLLVLHLGEEGEGDAGQVGQVQGRHDHKLHLLKDTKWKYYTLHNSALFLEDMKNLHFVQSFSRNKVE